MRFILVLALTGLLSFSATAQNGFYFAPSVGLGTGSSTSTITTVDKQGIETEHKRSLTLSASVKAAIGYQYKNWRFSSGIQYLKSGYAVKGVIFNPESLPRNPTIATGPELKQHFGFSEIGIPLEIAYAYPITDKFSVVLQAGVLATCTFAGTTRYDYEGETVKNKLSSALLAEHGTFRGWLQGGGQFEYKLNNKIAITAGVQVQFTLAKTSSETERYFSSGQYMLGIHLGL